MDSNNVWKFTKRPDEVKPLKTKWVFRLKENENGQPVRYKARLVVKGFLQRPGIDYEETFAPVARLATVRVVLAVGVHYGFHLHQMDVKTAFLHGDLKEELYIEVPEGVLAGSNTVCKLQKSIYGLKQSPRCWNERLNSVLLKLGFTRSRRDYCLYSLAIKDDEIFLVIYVDDVLIVGRNLSTIIQLKQRLSKEFEMSDCGNVKHFLGMKFDYHQDIGKLKLSQEANALKILAKFGMSECNPVKTPMEKGLQLSREGSRTAEPYRELLGSVMYQMLCVRPNLCFPVSYLGRFQQCPTEIHWKTLKRTVRYLKATSSMGLVYAREDESKPLVGYVDSDWASDLEDRKSVTGFIFKVFGSSVSWASRKQATVSTSSSEAEYVALSAAVSEAIFLNGLLEDLNCKADGPVPIFEDNRGCIGMARNPESKRVKHIDIKHHFVRDNVAAGIIQIEPISTMDQQADIFTKSLDTSRFQILRSMIGVTD